jgi:hypothetical protein
MAAISLPYVQQIFQAYDRNRDGKMDSAEVAGASLGLLQSGDQTGGSFMAALVQGGSDRRGMFPDFNGDQLLDTSEIARLASSTGQADAVESADLQAVFGSRYQSGGAGVDTNNLQQWAALGAQPAPQAGQQPGAYGASPPSAGGGTADASGSAQQCMLQMMQMMMQMMQMLLGQMMPR